jgi:hypothetical protein
MKLKELREYPDGKTPPLNEANDLTFRALADYRIIHVKFGKPVEWLAMSPEKAREFAGLLVKYADKYEM